MAGHLGSRDGQIEALCWCGASIKRVDSQMIRNGQTWSCGRYCSPTYALTRKVGSNQRGRDRQKRKVRQRPQPPITIVEGGRSYVYEDDGTGHWVLVGQVAM